MKVILYISKEDLKLVGKEHNMTIMNHKYDIDWMAAWIVAERCGMLGVSEDYCKRQVFFFFSILTLVFVFCSLLRLG